MADESARQILRTALVGFDVPHLQKIIVAAYDRWNWDTNSETDKDWFEIAEEILRERGVNVTMGDPQGINFSDGNGTSIPVLSMDVNTKELVLGTSRTLSVVDSSLPGNMTHELFEVSNSNNLELGFALKQALATFIANELNCGSTMNPSGMTIRQALEGAIDMRAPQSVKNML